MSKGILELCSQEGLVGFAVEMFKIGARGRK